MNVNRIEPKHIKGDELHILFFGDQHIGSKDCDTDGIKKQIDWIKKQKNVVVIMMGDTESGTGGVRTLCASCARLLPEIYYCGSSEGMR